MMGVSHAVHGAAVGAALLPVAPVSGLSGQVAWVAGWSGYALLNDADSGGVSFRRGIPRLHGSSVARMWGPFSAIPAQAIARVSGGHRNGTHSILGVAAFTGLAWVATLHPAATMILVAVSVGLALRAFAWAIPGQSEKTWPINLAVSLTAAYAFTYGAVTPWGTVDAAQLGWLPVAVAGGMATHIVGDMLTPERCPLLWPVNKRRFGLGLFTTGRRVGLEVLLVVAFAAGTVWFCYQAGMLGPVVGVAGWWAGPGVAVPVTVAGAAGVAGVLAWREYQSATSH